MEDDIVPSVQGTDGGEADTEQDCGPGLEDSVYTQDITQRRPRSCKGVSGSFGAARILW